MSSADIRERSNQGQYGTFNQNQQEESEDKDRKTRPLAAYTTIPNERWSLWWNFQSTKGMEWFHLYLWMAKDLSWTQDFYIGGMFFGTAAVVWSGYLLFQAFQLKNYVESWHFVGQFFWLLANYWWMWGEIHDSEYPEEPPIFKDHTYQASAIMTAALLWIVAYYAVIAPFKLLPETSEESKAPYKDGDIEPHPLLVPYIPTWRHYENLHILFWLGKDTAWIHRWPIMWWPFAVFTVAIAVDFVVTTSSYPGHGISHAHYIAQAIWVLSNLVWAYSELYFGDEDPPIPPLFSADPVAAASSSRWVCSWFLVGAFAVVLAAHVAWIYVSTRPAAAAAQKSSDPQASR
jgi:hypothetical protein